MVALYVQVSVIAMLNQSKCTQSLLYNSVTLTTWNVIRQMQLNTLPLCNKKKIHNQRGGCQLCLINLHSFCSINNVIILTCIISLFQHIRQNLIILDILLNLLCTHGTIYE